MSSVLNRGESVISFLIVTKKFAGAKAPGFSGESDIPPIPPTPVQGWDKPDIPPILP